MSKVTDLREVGIGVSFCGSMEETDLFFWRKKLSCFCQCPVPVPKKLLPQICSCQKLNPVPEILLLPQICSCHRPDSARVLLLPEVQS
ncbi:hypothetical protein WMY93_005864 [Mugilogobius chulae]|uniref:Uncharacterized protein n=1 Tax=Mugilogobius chulae TaxID=88201 RepID=A0AAW0PTT6_9GOBI